MDITTRNGRIEPSTRAYILQTRANINFINDRLNKPRIEQSDVLYNELLPQYERQLAVLVAMEENETVSGVNAMPSPFGKLLSLVSELRDNINNPENLEDVI